MSQSDKEVRELLLHLSADLQALKNQPADVKRKYFRKLLLKYHPDKSVLEAEISTGVFQWLQAQKSWFMTSPTPTPAPAPAPSSAHGPTYNETKDVERIIKQVFDELFDERIPYDCQHPWPLQQLVATRGNSKAGWIAKKKFLRCIDSGTMVGLIFGVLRAHSGKTDRGLDKHGSSCCWVQFMHQ